MSSPTARQILDTPMGSNDADASTVRDYLVALVAEVWKYGEEFSGKRPFGNSGWRWELYTALADAGHTEGEDDQAAVDLIASAIKALGGEAPC